ncbi:MAG: hypothetical protein Q9165_007288 [Trypethelium subeluteriae]
MAVFQSSQSILVVGGCGFFGAKLVERLVNDGNQKVSVIDINVNQNKHPAATYYQADISTAAETLKTFRQIRPNIVFHSATPRPSLKDRQLYTRVNIDGTRNALSAAKDVGVTTFIYTSSASVAHDNWTDLDLGDERLPILHGAQQREFYSESKAVGEVEVLQANSLDNPQKNGLKMLTAAVRPVSIFGPGDPGVTTAMCTSAKQGKFKTQMGNGQNKWDFVYIDNLILGHLLVAAALQDQASALAATPDKRVAGEAFVITNDDPYLFWGFARQLGGAAGYPTDEQKIKSIPKWLGLWIGFIAEWAVWLRSFGRETPTLTRLSINFSMISRTWNIDKAKQRLGYKPAVSMEEGIRRAGHWFASQQESSKKDR